MHPGIIDTWVFLCKKIARKKTRFVKNIITPSCTVYQFVHDDFGRTTQIKVGNEVLSTTEYKNVYSSLVSRMTYGNDVYKTYAYDHLDRLVSEGINGTTSRTYLYDKQSNLVQVQDFLANVTTKFQYDLIGRTFGINMSDGQSLRMIYDNYNRVAFLKWSLGEESFSTGYIYGDNAIAGQKAGLLYGVTLNGEQKIGYTYDALIRLESKTLATETPFVTEYGYLEGNTVGTTTTLVKTVKNGNTTLEYAYDAVGNITSVKKNGVVIESYTYDALNQLTGATYGGNTYTYAYDNGGNITEVKKNGTVIKSYTYGNTEWKDQLTAFNGETITYDEIGNPLTYRNNLSFTWQNGRQLATITQNGNLLASYTYNADGLRTSKTVSGVTTEYYWMNGTLFAQKTGEEYLYFLYDESGTAYGFVVKNNTEEAYYYYEFNLQGDIIGIINSAGTKVVEYTYGAWGDILSITGSMATTVGQKNPLRYRGYYYDGETGFYLTSIRYYDPEISRFINADGYLAGVGGDVRGYNTYTYCFNNPVNMSDPNGTWPRWITAVVAVTAVVVGVAALATGNLVLAAAAGKVAIAATATLAIQTAHYDFRKQSNDNDTLPKTYDDAMNKKGADDSISAACHQFTASEKPNKKVCWPDGREAIYNASGDLVLDSRDIGTYNAFVPDDGFGVAMHTIFDVVPWIVFGNDDDDTTLMPQRLISLFSKE